MRMISYSMLLANRIDRRHCMAGVYATGNIATGQSAGRETQMLNCGVSAMLSRFEQFTGEQELCQQ